jgi:parallel beta-helix repeat protein
MNSKNQNITSNTIMNSKYYSIYLSDSSNSKVNMNILKDSISDGLFLKSSNCVVENNTFLNNNKGIILYGNDNTLVNNTLQKQSASGIYGQIGTNLNKIYLNKFIKNGKSAQDLGENQWYYEFYGNYWSDYNYIDKDLDGIGDIFYSKNGVLDKYPLGYFLKAPKKPDDPAPKDFEDGVGLSITLKVHVVDPDSEILTVYFYRGDDDSLIKSNSLNPVKYVLNDTEVQCKFYLGYDTVFTWYAIVDDGLLQNKSNPFIFSTRKTPPDNDPPIANAGGPYFTQVDDLVQFDSAGSYDPDGTIAFYRWNFGDGSSEILEENPTHIYENPMEYQVTLTIIDNDGSSTSTNTFVSVGTQENDPPVAKITFVETAKTGNQIFFDSSQTYDPDGDNLTYLWDFGNGQNSTTDSPVYRYTSSGNYVITLTVSDGEYTDIATGAITIKAKSSESPGFELILLIIAAIVMYIIKKRKL